MIHLSCGGQVLYRREESFWFCGRCGQKFSSIEEVEEDNLICERSDD